ncbi:hypothetical protein ACSV5K_23600 [Agrobacterium pusense]|uniref:hypothetical protein n=1 Tax=Agrobacterium pusense TaxID=648995 RepID=UPI003FD131B6
MHRLPGGMLSNFRSQLETAGLSHRFDELLHEVAAIRRAFSTNTISGLVYRCRIDSAGTPSFDSREGSPVKLCCRNGSSPTGGKLPSASVAAGRLANPYRRS